MSIVVYWLQEGRPHAQVFTDTQLLAALKFSELKRKETREDGRLANSHVVTHSELGDCVSKPGVSDELPEDYSWSKQHRGGPPESGNPPRTLA